MTLEAQKSIMDEIKDLPDGSEELVRQFIFTLKNPNHSDARVDRETKKGGVRLGLVAGKYKVPSDPNAYDDEIAEMFGV